MKKGSGKLDFIKMKDFCSTKDTVKRMRRLVIDQEEKFAKETSDKGFLSKIYKDLLKLNNNTKQPD